MEMSVGTIVTIVLLVSVLILGLVLIQNIFKSGKRVVDLTDAQLSEEINKLFGSEDRVSMYPGSRHIELSQGEVDGFGFGIQNLLTGGGTREFSYDVLVASPSDLARNCNTDEETVYNWISTGKSEEAIRVASGDKTTRKVLMTIPPGSPLCTFRLKVNVDVDGEGYASDFMDITIKA